MSLKALIAYCEFRASEARLARDGRSFQSWTGRAKWVRSKIHYNGIGAFEAVKCELEILVEDCQRREPWMSLMFVEMRERRLKMANDMLARISS